MQNRKTKSSDSHILFLERCLQFLKPGGRLGIVLPDGILANSSLEYVRRWIEKNARIIAVISLPDETFSPFGANVKTSLVFLQKWSPGKKEDNYDVYMARVDNIGYDATGREKSGSEVEDIINDFHNKTGWA